nr:reverse transcriptase domain-containing protein [Tanacetum cinerariifolium]
MENTILELVEIFRPKELYCMHDNVDDLIESALNSKLLSINSKCLNKERHEVKNVVDDEPMWAADRVITLNPGFTIIIPETANEFAIKELISNKHKIEQISVSFLSNESLVMIQNKVAPKLEDTGSFLIPCNFNKTFSCNDLADLGSSINLMPYSLYAKLSLETLKPTKMSVRLADRSFQYFVRIAEKCSLKLVNSLSLPISLFSAQNKSKRVSVLKKHKEAFSWKTTNIPGICPSFCKHKIQLLDDKKSVVQKQRRLNPNMQEVIKKQIVKLLDTGIIYLIADSPWVSPIHCVPKKGGIIVFTNEIDELVLTRTVTGWRVCIDYRKLNEATAKDHFPLPFMDQMLERLT